MAIITMEGFEGYSSVTQFENMTSWQINQDSRNSFDTGRTGGLCLHYTGAAYAGGTNYFYFNSYDPILIIGYAFKIGTIFNTTLLDMSTWGATGFRVSLENNQLKFYRVYGGATLLGTYESTIYPGTWYYLEVKVKHATEGFFTVRLNEQTIFDGSGNYIGFQEMVGFKQITLYYSDVMNCSVDDFYLLDSSGSTFNDFLGDIRIDTIHPNGAGNYAQLTPSAGNNYECVDEAQYDDTDYIYSANIGNKDSYTFQDVPTELDDSGIYALRMVSFPKRTVPADNIKLKHLVRQGGVDYVQTEQSLPETFYMLNDYVEKDPSDDNPWTKAKINSAEFGVEVA
jgi:hypothetical protein